MSLSYIVPCPYPISSPISSASSLLLPYLCPYPVSQSYWVSFVRILYPCLTPSPLSRSYIPVLPRLLCPYPISHLYMNPISGICILPCVYIRYPLRPPICLPFSVSVPYIGAVLLFSPISYIHVLLHMSVSDDPLWGLCLSGFSLCSPPPSLFCQSSVIPQACVSVSLSLVLPVSLPVSFFLCLFSVTVSLLPVYPLCLPLPCAVSRLSLLISLLPLLSILLLYVHMSLCPVITFCPRR